MVTVTTGLERFVNDEAARVVRDEIEDAARGGSADFAPDENFVVCDSASTSFADEGVGPRQIALRYEPFPKQREFHASPAKYRLFGGAAGPGKSKALLMEAILQAHETAGANTLLLRRTFPELEQSLLLYFRRDVPRELYKSFHESKHVVTWWNGSTTRFGYCQREADVYQYQGAEFLFIGIDELTLFTLRQWQFLTSRNRCPVPGAFPCMAGATNPGNIGHAWVKSLWIDKQPASGMEHPEEFDASDYDFIPARVSDNPIYAADKNYLKTLRALPSHLKRAFLDGDWEVFAGQYFDRFDCSRHVTRAERIDWKPWWPRWISIDWGFEHPAAAYWHAQAPANAVPSAPNRELSGQGSAVLNSVGAQHAVPGKDSWCDAAHSSSPDSSVIPRSEATRPAYRTGRNLSSDATGEIPRCARDENKHRGTSPNDNGALDFGAGYNEGDILAPAVPPNGAILPSNFAGHGSAVPLREQGNPHRIVTYREFVTHRTSPRDLAREIVARSLLSNDSEPSDFAFQPWNARQEQIPRYARDDSVEKNRGDREKIDAIYLSPDAFARRTDEASIAEQMGDVFAAAGFPRPIPADNDRVGGWMLMYQMLDAGEWLLTDNCIELIRTIPTLVRDPARIEDIEKMDGDDPADAARYGLKSRYAGRRSGQVRPPLEQRLAERVTSTDPTGRAMQALKAQIEISRGAKSVPFICRSRRR